MGRRRKGNHSDGDSDEDDDLGLGFDVGGALDNMTERSASTRTAAMTGLTNYLKSPPPLEGAVKHFHSILTLSVRMIRSGKSAKEREMGAKLFQLGCLVAGADVNVSMDEYMIGGLADLAVQKSQTVVQAHAVQCIASLTMISDDGPHETKAALEIILSHVMSGRANPPSLSRVCLGSACALIPLLTPSLLSSPAASLGGSSGGASLMESVWERGLEMLGCEKMDPEVRVAWGWLMGVLAEAVGDGATPPARFLFLSALLEAHANTSDKSIAAADKSNIRSAFSLIASRFAGIARRIAAERGDLLDDPEDDGTDFQSDLLNPDDIRGDSDAEPWSLTIKIGAAKHTLSTLTLRHRHKEITRILGTGFQAQAMDPESLTAAMLGFGGENTSLAQKMSKRDKRMMMSPNSEACRTRTKERRRDRDAVARGFMAPDEE